jgi:hypothetical protein
MTQRQWLNVIIISLAFSTLLFLFAHQRLTRNLPSNSQWDAAVSQESNLSKPVIQSDYPIEQIQFENSKFATPAIMSQWQHIKLEPFQANLKSPTIQNSIRVSFKDEQQLFSIVLDEQKYYLLRHKDQQLFNLPHQTYVVLVPATYNLE